MVNSKNALNFQEKDINILINLNGAQDTIYRAWRAAKFDIITKEA